MKSPILSLAGRIFSVSALYILCSFTTGSTASPSRIAGHWEGAVTRFGAEQIVTLDIRETDSGLAGTYDIPDLILYREPLKETSVISDTLVFRLLWGTFTCIVHADIGEVTGQNLKWGPPVSIHLRKAFKPDRYRIEPVQFQSDSIAIRGDLLIPTGNPPFPAVVIIEGSTTEGRGLWTYRSLGDLFAQNGIAAFVYDKRGVGTSGGKGINASFGDLSNDAANAVRALAKRSDIDSKKIGLLGISQGGWLGPLAARKCDTASFLILYSGPAVSVWDQELDRVEYSMRAGSLNEDKPDSFSVDEINAAVAHTRLGFEVAENSERWSEWQASVAKAKLSRWAGYVALDSSVEELQGWLRQRYDPAEVLEHTEIPVLAMFGEDDVLVPPKENVERMRSFLKTARNQDLTIVVFSGVGHALERNATLVGDEWKWPSGFWRWARKAPGVADSLVLWTQRHTLK